MNININELKAGFVSLKKPSKVNDYSKPKLDGYLDENDVEIYSKAVKEASVESWLECLKSHTFETRLIPISIDDARNLTLAYEEFEQSGTVKHMERFDELCDHIKLAIEEWRRELGDDQSSFFMKLSSRSAKDAAIHHPKLKSWYRDQVKFMKSEYDINDNSNTRIRALLWAALQALKVDNVHDILWQLTHSHRVWQDMTTALEDVSCFNQNICLRVWNEIDISMEFRGFVTNGNLNALCQYNHSVFFPDLVEKQQHVVDIIRRTFDNEIKSKLKNFKRYVIDFGICKDGKVIVIELNPFLESTDAALFSWSRERSLLENGPFEFRIRTRAEEGFKANLMIEWRNVIDENL